jgi:hypothetical protein
MENALLGVRTPPLIIYNINIIFFSLLFLFPFSCYIFLYLFIYLYIVLVVQVEAKGPTGHSSQTYTNPASSSIVRFANKLLQFSDSDPCTPLGHRLTVNLTVIKG